MAAPPMPKDVAAAFEAMDREIARPLKKVRAMIFDAAAREGVGPLSETLKWGKPAYLTEASKAGSTLRLGRAEGKAAVLFNCNTSLVAEFMEDFGPRLRTSGKRALFLDGLEPDLLAICLARALTYHRNKKEGRR